MKWIGQHIWSLISRFRSDVYLEDVSTGTIASGGNLGLDSNNKIVKAAAGDALSFDGSTANGVCTYKDADEISVEANFTYDGNDALFASTSAFKPILTLQQTLAGVAGGPTLIYNKAGRTGVDGDLIGQVYFKALNDADEVFTFANIQAKIADASDGAETGELYLGASTVSTSNDLKVTGTLTMGSTAFANNSGVVQVATQGTIDHDSLANFVANEHIDWTGASAGTVHATNYTNTTYSEATGSDAGLMSTAHHDKLDGIEDNATADQTQADINGLAITTVGTIGTGAWNGSVIASDYLDSDTAHLSSAQAFLGQKTFRAGIILDGDRSTTPGDGAAIHVDASDITDNNTSASGTATAFNHVNIENPRIMASNALVTTTNASTVFIKDAPVASTNQTITNAYALWVAGGNVKLGSDLEVAGDITVTGNDIKDSGGNSIISSNGSGVVTMPGGNINIDGSNSNFNFNNGSDIVLGADVAGGTSSTIMYLDSGSTGRYMLMAEATNKVVLCNRAANGTVQIRANTSTAGSGGEVTVATFEDDKVTISQDLDVTGNVLPGITYIKILPSDFIADDGGRPLAIDDTGSDRWLESHGTNPMFASVEIPAGFKATHVDIYGDGTSAVTVYEADINTRTVTSKGTGNIGTQINITDVTSDATNYLLIELVQTSGEQVNGGKVTIAKA